MITPIEIQSKTFKSGGLGYEKKDVDGFMKEVLNSYETIYRENMELNDKISVLTEGIQYYKTIEKTLQKALVLAEKTAEDTKAAAQKAAKNIESEARTKSQLILADAKNELEHIHNQTIQLIQQYEKYKAQFKNLAQAQIEVLESDSFSINVARLDAFINEAEADQQKKETKRVYNIDLKKVMRESENESEPSPVVPKGGNNYTEAMQEASAAKERIDIDSLLEDDDAINYIDLNDEK